MSQRPHAILALADGTIFRGVSIGIEGINTGEVVSGNIGSETLRRFDYTVIGDVVNTAQRIQSAAQPAQIAISKEMYEQVKDSFSCRPIGEIKVKNKMNPIEIYEVLE